MEKKDIKVKKDHFVAKILCGSLIPIGGIAALGGIAYHVYWQVEDALKCTMWLDPNSTGDYIWEGNVNRSAKFKFTFSAKFDADTWFDRFELTVDNQPVKIKKIVRVKDGEVLRDWTIQSDGSIKANSDDNNIYFQGGMSEKEVIIEIASGFKGHVIAKLHQKSA